MSRSLSGLVPEAEEPRQEERPAQPPPGQLENPEPAGPLREEPVEVQVELPEELSWETGGRRRAHSRPGRRPPVRFRFDFRPDREAPEAFTQDFPVLETWVADAEGDWWHTRTFLHPRAITDPLTPAGLPGSRGEVRFWSDAPDAWRRAIAEECLVSGMYDLLDSRERFELPVGDQEVTLMLKYQGPRIDVAWLEQDGKLVVRAAEMIYEVWKGDGEYDTGVDRVCFGYRLDPSAVLPLTAPDENWTRFEGWFEADEPSPPVFTPAGGRRPPSY